MTPVVWICEGLVVVDFGLGIRARRNDMMCRRSEPGVDRLLASWKEREKFETWAHVLFLLLYSSFVILLVEDCVGEVCGHVPAGGGG